jgi:hypothetical protein
MADYTIERPIWPGSSSFSPGMTPFGFYDNDILFQQQIDSFAKYAAQHVGYPIMDVELIDINFYTAFEQAVIEYSNQVNQINITNNLLSTLGVQTGSLTSTTNNLTNSLVGSSLGYITKLSKAYGTEAGSGGTVKWYTASIDIIPGQQVYSIRSAISESGIVLSNSSSVEIRKVIHQAPPAIVRYFDPFVGTGLGSQNLMDSFDFGGFSPSVNFMMMPLHQDLLRLQSIEFNDQIRKSHFSFEIHGDDIRIYPIPGRIRTSSPYFGKVYFEFLLEEDKSTSAILFGNTATLGGIVTDASNIPYTNHKYSSINDTGRSWIYQYGAALAKETLGYVRNKYNSVPFSNGAEVTLNGDTLITQATSEKTRLLEELREFLAKLTKEEMVKRQQVENDAMFEILSKIPLKIYVG